MVKIKQNSKNQDKDQENINSYGSKGIIYICATPIGNLGDVSFRLIDTLKAADFILAEDTRKIRNIFSKYNINKFRSQIISYTDYSTKDKTDFILNKLKEGKNIALVSEAGMPAISDPGYKIINECITNNINISIIPGPNAALCALVLSGLPTDNFLFLGFLPKNKSKIKKKISEIKNLPYTLIFYESPLRTYNLLHLLLDELGNRRCCLAREITKIHEEVLRGKISEIINILNERYGFSYKEKKKDKLDLKGQRLKGEIVIVVEGLISPKQKKFDIMSSKLNKLTVNNIAFANNNSTNVTNNANDGIDTNDANYADYANNINDINDINDSGDTNDTNDNITNTTNTDYNEFNEVDVKNFND